MKIAKRIIGKIIKTDKSSKNKRACKYCGQVHKYEPFTDCHNPAEELPDDLGGTYESYGYERPFSPRRR